MATTKVPGTLLPAYPYAKRYVAIITQSSTNAPAEGTLFENTFGATMAPARPSTAGIYTFTCTGKFSTTNVICRVTSMHSAPRVCTYAMTYADKQSR